MLKIRLRKTGKSVKRRYHFKIVVMEAKNARDSRFVEELGYYSPSGKLLHLDINKYEGWLKKGAKPSETVASLFKRCKRQAKES